MARMHDSIIGQMHQFCAQGIHDLLHRAAPEIGASDASGEESIAGEKLRREHDVFSRAVRSIWFLSFVRSGGLSALIRGSDFSSVVGEIERDATGGVPRRVNDAGFEESPVQDVAFFQELIDVGEIRWEHAEEGCLHVHRMIKRKVIAVHEHRGACILMELAKPADVINMSVRADNGLDFELVTPQEVEDPVNFIAGIHDERFARDGVADNGAIALQHPYRDSDVNQSFGGSVQRGQTIAHARDYIIGGQEILGRQCMVCGAL